MISMIYNTVMIKQIEKIINTIKRINMNKCQVIYRREILGRILGIRVMEIEILIEILKIGIGIGIISIRYLIKICNNNSMIKIKNKNKSKGKGKGKDKRVYLIIKMKIIKQKISINYLVQNWKNNQQNMILPKINIKIQELINYQVILIQINKLLLNHQLCRNSHIYNKYKEKYKQKNKNKG